jgi:hypothetical protein
MINKVGFSLLLVGAAMIFFSSCSSIKVSSDYNKSTDFNKYRTFTLLPWNPHNDSIVSPFTKERLLNAMKFQMTKRGYKYVPDLKDADLGVNMYILTQEKTDYQYYSDYYGSYGYYYGYPWAWYGPVGAPYYGTSVQAINYIEGTIIIDIFDTKEKKLIWQGRGVGEITPDKPTSDNKINRIIAQIFYKYPGHIKKSDRLK